MVQLLRFWECISNFRSPLRPRFIGLRALSDTIPYLSHKYWGTYELIVIDCNQHVNLSLQAAMFKFIYEKVYSRLTGINNGLSLHLSKCLISNIVLLDTISQRFHEDNWVYVWNNSRLTTPVLAIHDGNVNKQGHAGNVNIYIQVPSGLILHNIGMWSYTMMDNLSEKWSLVAAIHEVLNSPKCQ